MPETDQSDRQDRNGRRAARETVLKFGRVLQKDPSILAIFPIGASIRHSLIRLGRANEPYHVANVSCLNLHPSKQARHSMKIDIGIAESDRVAIAAGLARLLADSYTLYLQTHNYHWNVTGPMFQTLHTMFEEHYTELAVAVDQIAERIRSLGEKAPGSYAEFTQLTSLAPPAQVLAATEMVTALVHSHEGVTRTARAVFPIAEHGHDEATIDLLTQRLQLHEKTAWMLRSLLE
jgi:starvation-inducible DNA-binding protein